MYMEKKMSLFNLFPIQGHLRRQVCDQRQRLYRIAWSWCQDNDRALDLAQETITRALEKIDSLKEEARLEVWLTRILSNLYRDQLRRQEHHPLTGSEPHSDQDTPEEALDRIQLIRQTQAAVMTLSNDHRQVLTLVDIADFSYADAARILDLPVGTIMSRLARARTALRQKLEPHIETTNVVELRRRK